MNPAVSVVIPVYGSATILPSLAERLEKTLSACVGPDAFEVVLIHDRGPDNAWAVIETLGQSRPWLRAIELRKNAGQHNAIMAGLSVARGRSIVTMDDDLQHDPESRQHVLWKRLGSAFNDLVASRLLKKPRGLYLSPFRGFRREIRDEATRYEGPFVYLDGLLLQSTSDITTIVAEHHARGDGKSGYSLRKSISLWLQMATSFSIAPLRLVSFAGIAASIVAFVLAAAVAIRKVMTPDMAVGWPSLIVTVLFVGGMQLLALGAIGEYTGRILLNVNKRPQFVIGKKVNLDGPEPDQAS